MGARTFTLAGGKYRVQRDGVGAVIGVWRNDEPWGEGQRQIEFSGFIGSMLNRIERLEDALQEVVDYSKRDGDSIAQYLAGVAREALK